MFLQFQGLEGPSTAANSSLLGTNYLLGVDNATFVPALFKYATISTIRPFFVLLASNVTWGQHPLMSQPGSSISIARPVVIAGQQGVTTSLDLCMGVNKVLLTSQHANLSADGVIWENLAYGDRQSGNQLSGLSLVNTFNQWFFFWDR